MNVSFVDDHFKTNISCSIFLENLVFYYFFTWCTLTATVRRSAFSTGFEFKYKEKEYGKDDLPYVKAKHKNLKEEIMESGYLSPGKWRKFVEIKALKYRNSETVQKIKKEMEKKGR